MSPPHEHPELVVLPIRMARQSNSTRSRPEILEVNDSFKGTVTGVLTLTELLSGNDGPYVRGSKLNL